MNGRLMPTSRRNAIIRNLGRLLTIAVVAILVNFALNFVLREMSQQTTPGARATLHGILIVALLLYAVLMAVPFVPSIEIGMSLLMIQGAEIAPFVFLATFSGLALAFMVGRFLPYRHLHAFFADLRLTSANQLLEGLQPLSQSERLDILRTNLPKWASPFLVRFRYLTIAVALNVPGNAFVGGGGGIALIAGLSGLFNTRLVLITFALAVAPIPLAVYFLGFDAVTFLER
jgi:branched-subunit amino acid transport protein AzlD